MSAVQPIQQLVDARPNLNSPADKGEGGWTPVKPSIAMSESQIPSTERRPNWLRRLVRGASSPQRTTVSAPADTASGLELTVVELRHLEQAAAVVLAVAELAGERVTDVHRSRYPAQLRDYAETLHRVVQSHEAASGAEWFPTSVREHRGELARYLRAT